MVKTTKIQNLYNTITELLRTTSIWYKYGTIQNKHFISLITIRKYI